MNFRLGIPVLVVAVAAGGWIAWRVADQKYFSPAAEMHLTIESLESILATTREGIRRQDSIDRSIDEFVQRTLGRDLESVDHRLRSHLNSVGAETGLVGFSVGTGRSRRLETPARRKFTGKMRDELDAVELEGWITGQGTLEQVLRLVHRLDTEPWLKRIDQVRLQPKDNGDRFAVTVRLVTLFLPDRAPDDDRAWAYDPSAFAQYASLIERSPFKVPKTPPTPPPGPTVVKPRPRPPQFPYGQWMVTGVAETDRGPEVWLYNEQTKSSTTLAPGGRLDALEFVGIDGDVAVFELGGKPHRITVGETLRGVRR